MEQFIQKISSIVRLESAAVDEMSAALRARRYRKGECLLKADESCRHFYFLRTGLVKLFFDAGKRDFVMTFFEENNFFTELSSFHLEKSSQYTLLAAEPTEVLRLDKADVKRLREKFSFRRNLVPHLERNGHRAHDGTNQRDAGR